MADGLFNNGTVTNLPAFIQNILNCVLKTNKAFTGLERVINDKIFILGWSNPLKYFIDYTMIYYSQ